MRLPLHLYIIILLHPADCLISSFEVLVVRSRLGAVSSRLIDKYLFEFERKSGFASTLIAVNKLLFYPGCVRNHRTFVLGASENC